MSAEKELRSMAAQMRARAKELRAEAERDAKSLEAAAAKVEAEAAGLSGGLQSYEGRSTIHGVTEGQMRGMQAGIRVRKGELHPLQSWLYDEERTVEPRTLKKLAEWLGGDMTVERVTSWCKRGAGARRVPASVAARLAAIGFPSTDANWPNGVREGS